MKISASVSPILICTGHDLNGANYTNPTKKQILKQKIYICRSSLNIEQHLMLISFWGFCED